MIEIQNKGIDELQLMLKESVEYKINESKESLDSSVVFELNNLFSSNDSKNMFTLINRFNSNEDFNYEQLCELEESVRNFIGTLHEIKYEVDLDIFFKDGYTLDINKVKEKFNRKKLKSKYPNFDFEKLDKMYKHPPKTLKPNYNTKEEILLDEFVFRKYLIGIVQMVLDHMDLLIAVTGAEGSGKSTHVSQLMYMVWWVLTELNIVDYPFEIKDMFFNTLEKLRLKEDELFEERFRILALDEGNELHRQNWKDEEVQTFFQRLRRERFNQRIKFVCIPVLGELSTNIVLKRVNFITEMENTNDVKSGSLNKGRVCFYIIPRGDKVYSPAQNKELKNGDIRSILFENLKDKNFLKGMDKNILVKEYGCNGTWGFPEKLYEKELKDTNRTFQVSKGLKLSNMEAGYLYLARPTLKTLGIKSTDFKYATLKKFFGRLKKYYEEEPARLDKLLTIVKRKEDEKELKESAKLISSSENKLLT